MTYLGDTAPIAQREREIITVNDYLYEEYLVAVHPARVTSIEYIQHYSLVFPLHKDLGRNPRSLNLFRWPAKML